jgi:hypothetical protein
MQPREQTLQDFSQFCSALDIHAIISDADECGRVSDREKEIYAIAILRAIEYGDFGNDRDKIQEAVSLLWEGGYREGFNLHSFNSVYEEFFSHW